MEYINSKSKIAMGVGDLNRDPANDKFEITDSDEETAQIFADYFSSVFT